MALRIIRKSSSQSQVELIKGSADSKPAYSLLACVASSEELEALKQLLSEAQIQAEAEVLIYRAHGFETQLRGELPPLQHTAKLINESKPSSWSLRLRTLIQESGSEIGVFLPFVPAGAAALLPQLVTALRADASLGLAAPALAANGALLAAGQETALGLPAHSLNQGETHQAYAPEQDGLFYLYRGLPLALWQQLASAPLQVSGAPLPLAAIRREAYLALAWADQDWNPAWLAQDLALGLRQKQYRLTLLPACLSLNEAEAAWLEAGAMPEGFKEKWQALLRQVVYTLYRHHGWRQRGDSFSDLSPPPALASAPKQPAQPEQLAQKDSSQS